MKLRIGKFQQGGPVAPPVGVAGEGVPEGQDPVALLVQGAAQALETGDCNVAMQLCQFIVEQIGGAAGVAAPVSEPPVVQRKGGVLQIKKSIK
jgi:hypothetical protein